MGRLAYVGNRLVQGAGVLLGVLILIFMLIQLTGDPAEVLLPADASQEDIARLRADLALDKPLPVQLERFLVNAAHGDFGTSFRLGQPALPLVLERLPATMKLAFVGLGLAVVLGIPAGVIAGARRGTIVDSAVMLLALIGQAAPAFWVGIMLILLFGVALGILPTSGYGSPLHLVLPAFTVALNPMARIARVTRSSMLNVMLSDYMRTARAKGVSEARVIYRHGLRNALIPPLTVMGLEAGTLLGGSVVIETVFGWPGVGRFTVQSILARDYPVVFAAVFLVALTFVLINFLVDLSYSLVDPRVQVR